MNIMTARFVLAIVTRTNVLIVAVSPRDAYGITNEEGYMTDAALRNIIAGEFRALQQRMLQQSVTKADLMSMTDRILTVTATRRDQESIRAMIEDLRSEVKSQQQMIRQHSTHIESLNQNTKNTTNQLGTLWRFVQQ